MDQSRLNTQYSSQLHVSFRKPAGCGIDYPRLLGVAEKCLCAGRLRLRERPENSLICRVQNAREELHIHSDNRKKEIYSIVGLSACPQRTDAYAVFQEQG